MRPCVPRPAPKRHVAAPLAAVSMLACALLAGWPGAVAAAAVYRWVDADGVTHLSSDRPPAGIKFERLDLGTTRSAASKTSTRPGSSKAPVRLAAATPEQTTRRNAAFQELQTRECVVSLESLDRLARHGAPVDPDEFRRLQQTADRTCSADPTVRRQQEEMAAKLRVAKGDSCVDARNKLADMLEPGRKPSRAELKSQQEFIEAHCEAPVR